jgi:hypothetical protein
MQIEGSKNIDHEDRFIGPVVKAKEEPNGSDVVEGSRQALDVIVPVDKGKSLHFVYDGGKKLKITLVDDNKIRSSSGLKLSAISINEVIRKVLPTKKLQTDGRTFQLKDAQPLERMLNGINRLIRKNSHSK